MTSGPVGGLGDFIFVSGMSELERSIIKWISPELCSGVDSNFIVAAVIPRSSAAGRIHCKRDFCRGWGS